MDTYSIYDFYNFVQNISIVFSVCFAIILFLCVLAFLGAYDYKIDKKELIFSIVIAFLFFTCLIFSIFMNYLQIR
jgi:hypothetical protein